MESSDSEVAEGEYVVEKIVDRRKLKGRTQYLIKWEGYSSNENTWEDADNLLHCIESIKEFEKSQKKKDYKISDEDKKRKGKQDKIPLVVKEAIEEDLSNINSRLVGWERGDEIDNILGARMIGNELHFYVGWKGKSECSFVPARELNVREPQKVISFYESRLRFSVPEEEDQSPFAKKLKEEPI